MEQPSASPRSAVPWWQPTLLAALAGAMGWGIRGQYGHETGAMIAGLLVSLGLVLCLAPHAALLPAARAVAMGTIAIGFGGSMTYGQTVGLTHDAPLVGNWEALRWGMLGLAIKGGLWIGFAGLFLGMGLGGKRYRSLEMLLILLAMLGLHWLGVRILNEPFDPSQRLLPRFYFSDSWFWEPNDPALKPRREVWGGLLFAFLGAWVWAGMLRRDPLARRLALWGALGGAIGFPLGQSLQAYHAWNRASFTTGFWAQLDPVMNWWNWMETTFGLTMGAFLGLGLWLRRRHIALLAPEAAQDSALAPVLEWGLLAVHVSLLLLGEFGSIGAIEALYDPGLVLGLIPMVAVASGRWWPFLLALPVTALPIAGKTIRELVYRQQAIDAVPGWLLYGVLPVGLVTLVAVRFAWQSGRAAEARSYLRASLLLATWLYFGLNYAFFRFPWPWEAWTSRTPNAQVFSLCALGLTVGAGWVRRPNWSRG
jgi:hypothetical protein